MNVTLLPVDRLSPEQIRAWSALQRQDPSSDSPYFRPELAQAMAAVRDGIEVAVMEEDGQIVGFFPFHRHHGNVGRPVTGPMSDFCGPVCRPGLEFDPNLLVRSCGLSAWHFDCLIAAKTAFKPYFWFLDGSPYIDTSQGFEAYQANRRQAGRETVKKTLQKLRKLEREVGPVRFEFGVKCQRALDQLFAWKVEQLRSMGVYNIFSTDWTRQLLTNLLRNNDEALSGSLATLHVKDELQAAFFCLRSHHVLHLWIVTYGHALSRYSPGYQLLVKLIQAAPEHGILRIDLGRGTERFKGSFSTGAIPIAEGSIDSRPATRIARRLWHSSRHWVGRSRLRGSVQPAWRIMKRRREQFYFR